MKIARLVSSACAVLLILVLGFIQASNVRAAGRALAPDLQSSETADRTPNIAIPDSKLTRDAAQYIRDSEGEFLFEHSTRVYYWAALTAQRSGLPHDPQLLYVAAMFHDYGLTKNYAQSHLRYEVDGANAAREFLRSHGVSEAASEQVWLAIALHTTNGIPAHVSPLAALIAQGANMDLVGAGYDDFTAEQRDTIEMAYPHPPDFAEVFMRALYDSLKHRPESTQGTGLADVMAYEDPRFVRRDFSALMRSSHWAARK
ncbi:HD domain-containing protein (plasmid) [Cupriavidus pinatubonensis]|uniref:HD domain-containing protein n=1 Tax=Cupriavidus pinatubonensis TaxID=248026 RepID=UPI001C73AFAC|nr:HD domain-containing protein [Cupriavidus pinatubonensis]QYY34068.1 HD domain-containing protein [Cupriavidus pinatubonensis]